MTTSRITTGVSGLDEILNGGLPANNTYLLMGGPGTGKTTFGLQFLLEGVRMGEEVLYITLLQTELGIKEMADSHGFDLSGIKIIVLALEVEKELDVVEQTLFPSSEIQLDDVMSAIESAVKKYRPARLVFDSIEQVRLLAADPIIYRQKILTTQRLLDAHRTTAFFVETSTQAQEFKTLAHGVFVLDAVVSHFGKIQRNILVEKLRGVDFSSGYHSFSIRTGGIEIYPRLPISRKLLSPEWTEIKSGIESLDQMLGGGLTTGTACLLAGESGTGKSSLATVYIHAAALRGEKGLVFLFDERRETYLHRAMNLGYDIQPYLEQEVITINQVNIGDVSAGELANIMRQKVEDENIKIVVMDSLTGFQKMLPEEPQIFTQLHETLTFLGQQGVLTIMVVTEHGMFGKKKGTVDISFLSDTVIIMRRFEAQGGMRIAMSAAKKRHGNHDKFIRELQLTTDGIKVGEPLHDFEDILTGFPRFSGKPEKLLDS